ncbi:MAG: hypothetical protein EG825_00625 [Rhodocyclaceae bacterium]|nr:hypothetical protein [Rhodocyclaceae bacterium]
MRIHIVIGPKGCGKTTHADDIKRRLGGKRIVDDWDGRTRLKDGDVALTYMELDPELDPPKDYLVVEYESFNFGRGRK